MKSLNLTFCFQIIVSIEDDDEIERDLSRAGLAQRNKNCVVQWGINCFKSRFSETTLKVSIIYIYIYIYMCVYILIKYFFINLFLDALYFLQSAVIAV